MMVRETMSDTNLAKLFSDGVSNIETKRNDNLFKDLDSRALTAAEEDIIAQRVALQRRMLEEYEKRERARKVKEIMAICSDLTEEEALCALKLHKEREDDAAAALTSGGAFKRKVQAMCGRQLPAPVPMQAPMQACQYRQGVQSVGAVSARPIGDFLNKIGEGVFVGTFRGRGWEHYTERMALIQCHLSPPKPQGSRPAANVGRPRTRSRDKMHKQLEHSSPPKSQGQGMVSPRRALAAANTSPPLPASPDQASISVAPELPVHELSPVPDVLGMEEAFGRAGDAMNGLEAEEPKLAAEAPTADGRRLAPAEDMLCEETALEPEEDSEAAGCSAPAGMASGCVQRAMSEGAQHDSGSLTQADAVPCASLGKESLSPAGAADALNEGVASPEAPVIPRGQRGKRSSRKRAASVLWGSSDAEERSAAPADRSESAAGVETSAAAVPEAKPEDTLDNDAAIARALAGECEAEGSQKRRKRQQRSFGTAAQQRPAAVSPQRDVLESVASPHGSAGAPRRSVRAPALPKPEPQIPVVEVPKKRRGRPPRGSAANHARAAAAAAALVNKPRLGRVKRCSSKQVDIVSLGALRLDPGWHNAGYIFPDGFTTSTVFRSSVQLDQLCMHSCCIMGEGGLHWPCPTFRVLASDRPDEPLDAKSPTGAWNAALSRINAEIEARREAGEPLPPPPKTAIAGPEYFGLTHPDVILQIESLDPEHLCSKYWNGKQDRLTYGQVYGISPERKGSGSCLPPRAFPAPTGGAARRRRGRISAAELAERNGEEPEEAYAGSRWSGVDRAERARRRHGDEAPVQDDDNPCPSVIDPITLEPVVTPAISPYGHVMGLATWNAVLAEQGKCPFTQQPLRRDQVIDPLTTLPLSSQIVALTKNNFERYRERIILQ